MNFQSIEVMARNEKLNKRMKEERKQKILSSATKLFAINGLAATKISDIAKSCGMSQGLLYHYYNSKEEIFTEIISYAFTNLNLAVKSLEKMKLSSAEKIKLALTNLLDGIKNNEETGYYHLLIAQATASESIPEESKKIINSMSDEPYKAIARILRKGQKEKSIIDFDAKELSVVFWNTIKGLAIYKASHQQNAKMPKPEILFNLFLR